MATPKAATPPSATQSSTTSPKVTANAATPSQITPGTHHPARCGHGDANDATMPKADIKKEEPAKEDKKGDLDFSFITSGSSPVKDAAGQPKKRHKLTLWRRQESRRIRSFKS